MGFHPGVTATPWKTFTSLERPERPVMRGPMTAEVVETAADPAKMGRVRVAYRWQTGDSATTWARLATPHAGNARGFMFLPEVGDEMLVMFEQGDVNHPYVIGAVWNGSDTPPLAVDKAVNGSGAVVQRIFKTRAGHTVIFDDSDDSPGIQIIDKTGNNKITQ